MFNDASQFIQGSSATVLSLGATDEIDLTATLIDINGNADVSGNVTASGTLQADRITANGAGSSNYAVYGLQNGSMTHAGYFQANGDDIAIEAIATGGTYSSDVLYVRQSSLSTGGNLARFANSTGDKVVITTAGNVGIGTSSPAGGATTVVDVYGSSSSAINFHNATAGTTATDGGVVGQYGNDLVLFNYEAGIIQLGTSNTERMRIDSSGNLLVGTTSSQSGIAKAAVEFDSASQYGLEIKDGGTGTIGTFAIFYKGTSPVGSIGTGSGGLFIGSSSQTSGISCFGTALYPNAGSSISATDGANDLGAPTARWKDLYLSGGAYLGGTAAANKLDDYEEGTFTPTVTTSGGTLTHTAQQGSYVKIGDVVYYWIRVVATNSTTATLYNVESLPFSTSAYASFFAGPTIGNAYSVNLGTDGTVLGAYYLNGASGMRFHSYGNNTAQLAPSVGAGVSFELRFEGHYRTTA
jgi:hypothetical protein